MKKIIVFILFMLASCSQEKEDSKVETADSLKTKLTLSDSIEIEYEKKMILPCNLLDNFPGSLDSITILAEKWLDGEDSCAELLIDTVAKSFLLTSDIKYLVCLDSIVSNLEGYSTEYVEYFLRDIIRNANPVFIEYLITKPIESRLFEYIYWTYISDYEFQLRVNKDPIDNFYWFLMLKAQCYNDTLVCSKYVDKIFDNFEKNYKDIFVKNINSKQVYNSKPEILFNKKLPDSIKIIDNSMILVNSAQFNRYVEIYIKGFKFELGISADSIIDYISISDSRFQTPEEAHVGMRFKDLIKLAKDKKIHKEWGWGHIIQLPSGWQAGFLNEEILNNSCDTIKDDWRVKWLFMR